MAGFNINDNPGGNVGAIPWLVKGLKTLWGKVNGIIATGGGGGGGTSDIKLFSIPFDYINQATLTPIFTATGNFIPTLVIAGMDIKTKNGDPTVIPVITVGWDAGSPPSDYQQIVPNAPVTPQELSYVVPFSPAGVAPLLMVPSGSTLVVQLSTPASSGFSAFTGHIYVTGYYA